jgi:hypothetical protein
MTRSSGVRLRVRTALQAGRLDLALARGQEPHASPETALRARQLSSQEMRDRLAAALEAAVRLAHSAPTAPGADAPVRRGAVRENSKALMQLADRLREDPVDIQGVAIARVLTTDGTSPLYWDEAPYSLGHVARTALYALEPVSAPGPATADRPRRLAASPGWPKAA